jgi:glucosamine--fructose-6-phosphate aminotransferase (isomerizing)
MSMTAPAKTLMFREAESAGQVVGRQLDADRAVRARIAARLRAEPPRAVVTCARGSSDHAATYGKYLIETRLGVVTSSAALSTSSIYGQAAQLRGVLYLAISQSGRSPDLLSAVAAAKAAGAFTIALVNDTASPLAAAADEVLPLHAGPEISVAATKSYIAALAQIAQLVAAWSEDADLTSALSNLPRSLEAAWALEWRQALPILQGATNLFVLGRGLGLAIAQEAALKFKETCGLHAEAFSVAEVMHGPMALIKPGFPVLAFAQNDATYESVTQVLDGFAARGAALMRVQSGPAAAGRLAAVAGHPALEPIAMIQTFYRFANALSVARGYNPDTPPHLRKVTETL